MSILLNGSSADTKSAPDLRLAGLVHDLNNVFQTLVDVADLLSHECSDPQSAKLAAAILRSVERGKGITIDLQGGKTPAESVVARGTALEKIVSNAIAFIEDSQIAGRGPQFHFSCHLEPDLLLGRAQSGSWAWERVFINLFVNSVRAMPKGGTVTVEAHATPCGSLEILVRDEGCGIAPELHDRLFEAHVSGNASTGLGLHIVKTIVESDGGTVSATNREGQGGAEFVITVPLVYPQADDHVPFAIARPAHA
jgi:K+-sensing histidine kinase KdpD